MPLYLYTLSSASTVALMPSALYNSFMDLNLLLILFCTTYSAFEANCPNTECNDNASLISLTDISLPACLIDAATHTLDKTLYTILNSLVVRVAAYWAAIGASLSTPVSVLILDNFLARSKAVS